MEHSHESRTLSMTMGRVSLCYSILARDFAQALHHFQRRVEVHLGGGEEMNRRYTGR